MRVGLTLSPTGNWPAVLEATRVADSEGLDAVGFWDHYHSERPEWAYICGWSTYGALAMATERIRLVPMVIDRANYLLGVLARETSMLSIVSGGRFELGIGAGDYPQETVAWGVEFPDASTRVMALEEAVTALRLIWKGELVTFQGEHFQLKDAACTPAPTVPPRVVVGAGNSKRMIRSAVRYADELNVYGEEKILEFAQAEIEASGRAIDVSVATGWVDSWPVDVLGELKKWADRGVQRCYVNLGYDMDIVQRTKEIAALGPLLTAEYNR